MQPNAMHLDTTVAHAKGGVSSILPLEAGLRPPFSIDIGIRSSVVAIDMINRDDSAIPGAIPGESRVAVEIVTIIPQFELFLGTDKL